MGGQFAGVEAALVAQEEGMVYQVAGLEAAMASMRRLWRGWRRLLWG